MKYKMSFFKELVIDVNNNADIDKGTVQAIFKEENGILFIVFRGTDSDLDWWNNFLFYPAVVPYDNLESEIKIHMGWLGQYKQDGVRDVVLARVGAFVKQNPIGSVVVTGHSYGAALAVICAVDIQYNNPGVKITAVPLSMPRVGNGAFIASFEKRVPYVAVYYGADIVHQVPPSFIGYKHLHNIVHFGPRKFWRVAINAVRAIYWWIRQQPMELQSIEFLWDHSWTNFPDDYEIIIR